MSMHKKPLTPLEEEGLRLHGLDIGTPSQLSDVFRHGIAWAISQAQSAPEPVQGEAVEYQQLSRYGNWDRIDKAAFDIGKLGQATERFRALYTAAAKPDAELVALLLDAKAALDPFDDKLLEARINAALSAKP